MPDALARATLPQIILKPRKARPFFGRHPWVLDSAIARFEGQPADGDVVELHSDQGQFIAWGIYNSRSHIQVRLYSWDTRQVLDDAFWRHPFGGSRPVARGWATTIRRGPPGVVFSEADGLSGLVVDRYGEYLAVQATALAMAVRLGQIVPQLVELLRPKGIMLRTERDIVRAEGLELRDGPYWGEMPAGPVTIRDGGLTYAVDLAEGQKTGFYLDQRENRKAAAAYLGGRKVLDMFCYSGGFALAAAAGGAREVLGVDTSAKAVALAEENARRNGLGNVRFQAGEAFPTLQAMVKAGARFDAGGARSTQVRPQPSGGGRGAARAIIA